MTTYIAFIKVPSTSIVQASNPKIAEKKFRKKHTSNPDTEVIVVPFSHAKKNGISLYKCKEDLDIIEV